MYSYSATTGKFYLTGLRDVYEKSSTWPADAVDGISEAQRLDILANEQAGKRIISDSVGGPALADPLPPTVDDMAARVRMERDARMTDFAWRYERNARENRLGIPETDTVESLDEYMHALASVTDQADFPTAVTWPVFGGAA